MVREIVVDVVVFAVVVDSEPLLTVTVFESPPVSCEDSIVMLVSCIGIDDDERDDESAVVVSSPIIDDVGVSDSPTVDFVCAVVCRGAVVVTVLTTADDEVDNARFANANYCCFKNI